MPCAFGGGMTLLRFVTFKIGSLFITVHVLFFQAAAYKYFVLTEKTRATTSA